MCVNHPDVCAALFKMKRGKRNEEQFAINNRNDERASRELYEDLYFDDDTIKLLMDYDF